eukprot:GHVR01190311.1.p1 GENE.GHVR01190311.1~~GHVR01190311.1.p1  ORF type:complete len:116 (-),score=8.13 GHVR01190311.1:73-420(-)
MLSSVSTILSSVSTQLSSVITKLSSVSKIIITLASNVSTGGTDRASIAQSERNISNLELDQSDEYRFQRPRMDYNHQNRVPVVDRRFEDRPLPRVPYIEMQCFFTGCIYAPDSQT